MNLICIPSLKNNYIWLLHDNYKNAIIIDPGQAFPVLNIIKKYSLIPTAILLTHNHADHKDGVIDLVKYFNIPVYGPKDTLDKYTTDIVSEDNSLILLGKKFYIIHLPGHTLNHLGFYSKPWLFCGDTMFSGGCGRLFEGTAKDMYGSLQKIKRLPLKTIICVGHEYTLNNLYFAISLLPTDNFIESHIQQKTLTNKFNVPTTLYIEKKINLFLRCDDIKVHKVLNFYPSSYEEEWIILDLLRKKKDYFIVK